ncbi:hypothetical protein R1flu_020826 [Riccia fluitans]|uniref:Uncharacterized protein n=1 Tax=Riccia fluitans TaxID=41844 RepID=A0ABD1ZMT6_9MARC
MALLWFCRYEEALGILEKDYPNGKEAVSYIKAIDPRKFSRYALVLPRYGKVTSNAVECMNAAFLKLREYAARRLLFEVWIYVMRSFYERRTTAKGSIDLLTEYAKGRLSEFEREYGRYVTYNANDDNALVQTNGGVDQWIVRRHPRLSCSCYEPQEMQWPCIHDEACLISSQGPLTAISDQAASPSTQDGRGKSQRSVNRVHVDPIIRVYRGRPRTTRVDLDPGRPLMRNERCFARNAMCGGLSAKWKMTKCETRVDRAKHNVCRANCYVRRSVRTRPRGGKYLSAKRILPHAKHNVCRANRYVRRSVRTRPRGGKYLSAKRILPRAKHNVCRANRYVRRSVRTRPRGGKYLSAKRSLTCAKRNVCRAKRLVWRSM